MDDSQALIKKALGDKYEIKDLIQSGGMGKIFLGVHRALGRKVAIKIIHQELVKNEDFKIRFYREAKLAASLDHHGIIDIYDFGSNDDFDYIIMPFIDGETLKECIKARGAFEMSEALDLMIKMTDALHYAHQHNVYHRDIKPANIMFDDRGRVVIADFGISKELGDTDLTAANTVLGSPRYMSPEQIKGESVDARSDLYSLGLVFYEMITGKHPFQEKDVTALYYAQAHEIPARPETGMPVIPKALGSMIMRLLEKTPEKRYPDGAALLKDLRDCQSGRVAAAETTDDDATIVDGQNGLHDDATIVDDATLVDPSGTEEPSRIPGVRQDSSMAQGRKTGFIKTHKVKLSAVAAVLLATVFAIMVFSPGESSRDVPDTAAVGDPGAASPPEEFSAPVSAGEVAVQEVLSQEAASVSPDTKTGQSEMLLNRIQAIGSPKHVDEFRLWTDRTEYRIGQPMHFHFKAAEPCYALVFVYTTAKELIQVFPNHFSSSQFVRPGRQYDIPGEKAGFDLQVTGPTGTDTLIALISGSPFDLLGSDFSEKAPFLVLDAENPDRMADVLKRLESLKHGDIYYKQTAYAIR